MGLTKEGTTVYRKWVSMRAIAYDDSGVIMTFRNQALRTHDKET